ncbi:hypothetical protein HDV00_012083 [Rhizophlyctis rosea]|nr:hypothetical protein HDV00_012083 [Rhizophlyctis rosea]
MLALKIDNTQSPVFKMPALHAELLPRVPEEAPEMMRIMDYDIPHRYVLDALHRIGPTHFNNPQTSDLIIRIHSYANSTSPQTPQTTPTSPPPTTTPQEYHIHNLFLSPQSSFFQDLYSTLYRTYPTTSEKPVASVFVPSPAHFEPLLRHMYTGNDGELVASIKDWSDLNGVCYNAMALGIGASTMEVLERRFKELVVEVGGWRNGGGGTAEVVNGMGQLKI